MLPPSPPDPAPDLAAERARLLADLRRSATSAPEPPIAVAIEGSPARGRFLAEDPGQAAAAPRPTPPAANERALPMPGPGITPAPPSNGTAAVAAERVSTIADPGAPPLLAQPVPDALPGWPPVGQPTPEADAPLNNDAQAQLEAYLRMLEAGEQQAASRPKRGPSIQGVLLLLVAGVITAGFVMVFRDPAAPTAAPVPLQAPAAASAPADEAVPPPAAAGSTSPARKETAAPAGPVDAFATPAAASSAGPAPEAAPPAPLPAGPLHTEAGQKALEAAGEAAQARRLNDEVDGEIDRYAARARREPLTAGEAEALKRSLRAKCRAALNHADRALSLDGRSLAGWVQRIRALRLTARYAAAQTALREARALYPDSADLKAEQELVGAGRGEG